MTSVVEAATIVLLRRVPGSCGAGRTLLDLSSLPPKAGPWLQALGFEGEAGRLSFAASAGWQVLLGQGEAQNWVRSEPARPAVMRYPGEWKLPGGRREVGESLEQAAWRELREEFGGVGPLEGNAAAPSDGLRLFSVKRTKRIQGVAFDMHSFVCLADESPWLAALQPEEINAALAARRARFEALLGSGGFWPLSRAEREAVAPEVRRVAWLPLHEACSHMLGSCQGNSERAAAPMVDEWQRAELLRLGVGRRDPMFQTLAVLLEVSRFESEEQLRRHCDRARARL